MKVKLKRRSFILLIFLMLIAMAPGFAQSPASIIDSLDIEIWPDYDKASVLVLLTGTLAGDTSLPAAVTLPLPEAAQLNAVARIDRQNGSMRDDISWNTDSPNTLTFITPDSRFRVEYYFPYTVNNNQRSFDFTWLADIPVQSFQLRVQRPTSAVSLNTEPASTNVVAGGDGFEYHTFSAQDLPAGQPFSLHVAYTMGSAQLSAASMPPPNTGAQAPALPAGPGTPSGFSWALAAVVAGGVIIIGAMIWQIASRRRTPDSRSANESRVEAGARTRFCRNCGSKVDEDDRFCRECGSEL